MKKLLKLAKSRKKGKAEEIEFQRGHEVETHERRKSTFSFLSELSGEFSLSKSNLSDCTVGGYTVNLSDKSDISFTKLHKACWIGQLDKVKKYVGKNDVNLQDNENRAPLHYASVCGKAELIDFLYNCNANFNLRDSDGKTPYLKAIECNHQHLIKSFLDYGSDVNICDRDGNNAVHIAVEANIEDLVKIVLQYGGNPDHQNKNGYTALHLACMEQNNPSIVYILLMHGAAVNTLDHSMRTCLMLAAQANSLDAVKALLDNSASIHCKDDRGQTAEDYAIIEGHHEIAELLSSLNMSQSNDESNASAQEEPVSKNKPDMATDNELKEIDMDSWNDSSDDFSSHHDKHPAILMPSLNLNDLLPSSSVEDLSMHELDKEKVARESIEAPKLQDMNPVVNESIEEKKSPVMEKKIEDKRKMSIVLGLVDEDDDRFDSTFSESSDSPQMSNVADVYVPTLVEHASSPVKTETSNATDANKLSIATSSNESNSRLYKKHTRTGSNTSINMHPPSPRPNSPKIQPQVASDVPILTDSDSEWDTTESISNDQNAFQSQKSSSFDGFQKGVGDITDAKEGTLGRFGTMAGVEEIWENNPSIAKPDKCEPEITPSRNISEDSVTPPMDVNTVGQKRELEKSPSQDSDKDSVIVLLNDDPIGESQFQNSREHSPVPITGHEDIDGKMGNQSIDSNMEQPSENKFEVPSKLTFRRKSLEPDHNQPSVSLISKRSRFTRSPSVECMDTRDNSLMRKISLNNCNEKFRKEMSIEENPVKKFSNLKGDNFVPEIQREKSVSPEGISKPLKQNKRRFSLAAGLRSRRKSVADTERQLDSLDLIPENEQNDTESQKRYGNRKQFRCVKVSPGGLSSNASNDNSRRASFAIGDAKPSALTSKLVMRSISRRLSLSSPEPDISLLKSVEASSSVESKESDVEIKNAVSPEPPSSTDSKLLDFQDNENAFKNSKDDLSEVKEDIAAKDMLLEDITSASLSDSEMLEIQTSDKETDFFDQTDGLSISSSDDEISEPGPFKYHQSERQPITEEMFRELRVALDKEIAQKKVLQNKVKNLQKDRIKYLRKIETDAKTVVSLKRNVLESDSKIKYLDFEVTEEKEKRENFKNLLDRVKEQLSLKEDQYMEELKLKESAMQKVQSLEYDIKSYTLDTQKMNENIEKMNESSIKDTTKNIELEKKIMLLEENVENLEEQVQYLRKENDDLTISNNQLKHDNTVIRAEYENEKVQWLRVRNELTESRDGVMKDIRNLNERKQISEDALDKACLDYTIKINELNVENEKLVAELDQTKLLMKDVRLEKEKLEILLDDSKQKIEDDIRSKENEYLLRINDLEGTLANLKAENSALSVQFDHLKNLSSNRSQEQGEQTFVESICDKIEYIKNSLDTVKEHHEKSVMNQEKSSASLESKDRVDWKEFFTQLQKEHQSINDQLSNHCSVLENKVKELQCKLESAQNDKILVEGKLKDKDDEVLNFKSEFSQNEKEIQSLYLEGSILKKELDASKQRIKSLEDSNDELKELNLKLKNEKENATKELKGVEENLKENSIKTKTEEALKIQIKEIENEQLKKTIQDLESQITKMDMDCSHNSKEKSNKDKIIENLHSKNALLEASLQEEKIKHVQYKSDADNHQSLWESELKTKSFLGLKLGEYEQRCMKYEDELKGGREKMSSLVNEKKSLVAKLDNERITSQKLKENALLLKTHLKVAKKRLKEFENEPTELYVRKLKDQLKEEKCISETIVKKMELRIKEQDFEIKQLQKNIDALQKNVDHMQVRRDDRRYSVTKFEAESLPVKENVVDKDPLDEKDINEQLGKIKSHLEEQAKNQSILDNMRTENDIKLRNELSSTRISVQEEVSKLKVALGTKIDEIISSDPKSKLKSFKDSLSFDDVERRFLNHNSTDVKDYISFHPHYSSSFRNDPPSCVNWSNNESAIMQDDGYSHLIQNQLEQTIQRHINSDPEVTMDIPGYNSQGSRFDHSSQNESHNEFYSALKKKYLL